MMEQGKKVFVWGESYSYPRNGRLELGQTTHFQVLPFPAGGEADGIPLCGCGAAYPVAKDVRRLTGKGYRVLLDQTPDREYKPLCPENRRAFSFLL